MSYLNIRRALEQNLSNLTKVDQDQIFFENAEGRPDETRPYLYSMISFNGNRPSSISLNSQILNIGRLTLTLYVPRSIGSKSTEEICDELDSIFKGGSTVLTEGDTVIRIDFCERQPSYPDSDRFVTPISISWYTYINP